MIFAVILNQKFRGRIFARAVFFLPVIIATGVVMKFVTGEALNSGAHLTGLIRTRVGDVRLEDCMKVEDFEQWLEGVVIEELTE